MMMEFDGQCACGTIRYHCSKPPLAMYHCHCLACQKYGNGGFSSILVMATAAVTMTGAVRYYTMPSTSSNHAVCGFCLACGSALCARSESNPAILVVRAASLASAGWFKPVADIWTINAQPWTIMDPHIPKVYRSPPVFEMENSVNL